MKLLRKAICISLAATMSLGLTACGGKANDNKTGVNSTVNKIEVAKEESAESTFGSDSSFSVKGLNGSMHRQSALIHRPSRQEIFSMW